MTQWTITKDFGPDPNARPGTNANATGIVGPSSATMTSDQIRNHPDGRQFRLFDDDGELYYEGVLVGDDEFAPLDDFGTPNAGATSVQILNTRSGQWQTV